MKNHHYIACDLGAESGRVILGTLANGQLSIEEIHRFSNGPITVGETLRWDVQRIFSELTIGLKKVANHELADGSKIAVSGISVDSWGVDYVLFNAKNPELAQPFCYRDARADRVYKRAISHASPEVIFANSGIQFMPINTLYQLIAELEQNPKLLAEADKFLNIGDYFNYRLSGVARAEQSLASTTQLYDPRAKKWSHDLIHIFELPKKIFAEIVPSGTVLGALKKEIAEETGLANSEVIATCSHDTGAAVAAIPADGNDWAFISSGTWSLIGVELPKPVISEDVRAANFTNEAGFGGTTRFLKNIVGLWILEECRREWIANNEADDAEESDEPKLSFDYDELLALADDAEPLRSLIDPNAAPFLRPGEMPEKIARFCEETDQPIPKTPGEFTRCILESLALLYRQSIHEIHTLTGRTTRHLHIVGGGSKNRLLNQFAASATSLTVIAGPVEATAIGNVLIQAIANGHLDGIGGLRKIVRDSFPTETFHPLATNTWQEAYERFTKLTDRTQ